MNILIFTILQNPNFFYEPIVIWHQRRLMGFHSKKEFQEFAHSNTAIAALLLQKHLCLLHHIIYSTKYVWKIFSSKYYCKYEAVSQVKVCNVLVLVQMKTIFFPPKNNISGELVSSIIVRGPAARKAAGAVTDVLMNQWIKFRLFP